MKRGYLCLLPMLVCLHVVPAAAQTAIGGGTCTSSTLSGTYEFLLSGRQLTPAGVVTLIFQGVGTATFDGLSKVSMNLTANTVTSSQTYGASLTYSGTYTLQANCVGAIDLASGDIGTFTLEAYSQGSAFAVVGSDAAYAYNGSGSAQPATCPTTITGAHEFNATGDALSGASVTSVLDVAGVMQFDGKGNLSASWTQVSNLTTTQVTASGTYLVGAGCLASGALTDSGGNKYTLSMSFTSASPGFALTVSSPVAIFDGSGAGMQAAAVTACSASMLKGTYELTLSGRMVANGATNRIFASDGMATFDGQGQVVFNLTYSSINGSALFGKPLQYSGSYTLPSSCQGAINISVGDAATFGLVAYNFDTTTMQAKSFVVVGTDASYAFNGSGTVQPPACAASTLSGSFAFSGTGNSLSGAANTGIADLAGIMQFDGLGNVTANWTQSTNSLSTNVTAMGTYSVTAACLGAINLNDTANTAAYSGAVSIFNVAASNFELVMTAPQLIFTGAGRSTFVNPGLALVNNSDFVSGDTPPGSVFSLFGSDLATKVSQPANVPLPTTVLTTTLTVNGEPAPLFYVSGTQIVAQMPEDIAPGVATVMVKNGTSTSNAVAVMIPATGTPQIGVYGNNRAVVTFSDYSAITSSNPAKPGDILVAWFTGGGPVNASGKLTSGAPSPAGLSPVAAPHSLTVGGMDATLNYMGLTPNSIGLYQANFILPNLAAGDHPVVITIAGQASNAPLISVK